MTLTSADFDKLGHSLEDLAKATRDNTAAVQKGGPGGAGPSGGAAGPVAPAGGGTGQGGGTAAVSLPTSALQSALSAGGMNGASSLLGGLSGGPVGVAAAAIGMLGQQHQAQQRVAQSGFDAYANSPVNESESARKFRADIATRETQLRADDTNDFVNVDHENEKRHQRTAGALLDLRFAQEKQDSVSGDIESRLGRFFKPFDSVGERVSKEQMQEVGDLFKMQADAAFANRSAIQNYASDLARGAPGSHGGRGRE